jgi:MFS family permease
MTLGSALGSVLLLAWASVENLWVLYLAWIGIGLAMAATLYEPAFAVLAKWFERGLARALLLVTLAGGLASTIFLPLTAWLVGAQGWRGALLTLGAILALLTIPPHALVLRRHPADLGLLPDGIEPATSPHKEAHAPHDPHEELESVALGVALRGHWPSGCSRRPSFSERSLKRRCTYIWYPTSPKGATRSARPPP